MVVEVEMTIREWGGSLGGTFPKDKLKEAHIKSGDKIRVLILPKVSPLKGTFGILKLSRPVEEILKETDQEAWDE